MSSSERLEVYFSGFELSCVDMSTELFSQTDNESTLGDTGQVSD